MTYPDADAPNEELERRTWRFLSEAVQRLEQSWTAEKPLPLGELLPAPDEVFRRRVLLELVKVDQEFRWKAGERKLTEAYLDEWQELGRDEEVVVELLEGECTTRAVLGDLPCADELRGRFPDCGGTIDLPAIERRATCETAVGTPWEPVPDGPSSASRPQVGDDAQTPPLEIGQLFGRYEVKALLGEGGMGWVYHAYDTLLQRDVALKIPRFCGQAEPVLRERFLGESRAAARIEHPHVCTVHDTGEIDGVCFITMRLVRGKSLAQRLQVGPLAPAEAARLAQKLASALEAIHRHGILHRDVKPSNVLLDDAGEPLLTDFGLARFPGLAAPVVEEHAPATDIRSQAGIDTDVESNTGPWDALMPSALHSNWLVGTVHYMPPELFQDQPPDTRSDIYSLGVVLYRMLTGCLPFLGRPHEVAEAILIRAPAPPSHLARGIPRELERICLHAMQKSPGDRYQSAGEMAAAIGQFLEHAPAESGVLRGGRQNAGLLVAATLVTVALVVASVLVLRPRVTKLPVSRYLDAGPNVARCVAARDGRTVYVSNALYGMDQPSTVQAFDVSSGNLVSSFAAAHEDCDHKGLAVTADGRYAFVTDYFLEVATRVNLHAPHDRTDFAISTLGRGKWGSDIHITPDQSKVVITMGGDGSEKDNNQLSVINLAAGTLELVGEVVLPGEAGCYAMEVSDDSQFAYVLCRYPGKVGHANTLHEIKLAPPYDIARTLELDCMVPIGNPSALTVCAATRLGRLFVCDEDGKRLRVVDLREWAEVDALRVEDYHPYHATLHPRDPVLAVVCRRVREIYLISAIDGTVIGRVKGLSGSPTVTNFSPDGRWLYVTQNPERDLAMVDVGRLLTPPGIVFASNRRGRGYEIFRSNLEGTEVKRLIKSTGSDLTPRWSPDGRRIGFLTDRGGPVRIAIMNAQGRQLKVLGDTDPVPSQLPLGPTWDWSPDGREMVFVGGAHRAIRVVDVDLGRVRTIVPVNKDTEVLYRSVCWGIPDRILAICYPQGEFFLRELLELNPATGAVTAMGDPSDRAQDVLAPSVSPDGRFIAALQQTEIPQPQDGFLLLDAAARQIDAIETPVSPLTSAVSWTSDGRHVVFSAGPTGRSQIYRLDLPTRTAVPLISSEGDDIEPDVFGAFGDPHRQ